MARYYFHLWNGMSRERDEIGTELQDADAAYMEAFETAQDLAIDMIRDRRNAAAHRLEVMDEAGRLVFEVPFTEVVGSRARPDGVEAAARRGRSLAAEVASEVTQIRRSLSKLRRLMSKV